ncbi:LLM class F420-dependent oxidoreductase [Sphaerisporangium siamense]|uniref:Putative F420-dependent oxidoreductase n=1 Tax=Sphaerisporangium siamense TaxID=795645 RepID=A0A7W7DE93_9ACTN|nr:TIGR03619 family F420-dependent LLM class oxidoreductase [Sphaerisporangium siamense]MBB4704061.1 putative F420-dependent oxidoreductase [Sphaerisporangium siamense]GII82536.1 LLM class F420-dependent oxidoreductase [Sphaerisporangium siamense]
MELGVALPTSGPLASPDDIARFARHAEDLGYDSLWTYERLLRPLAAITPPGGGEAATLPDIYRVTYEPLETLSYVAAITERIKLGTSVIDALFHAPVVLARRFATLDRFSGGRVIAGLGQGWVPQEFETANVPVKRMGAGMDEAVAAIRACWGPDPVEYRGRFYTIAPSEVNPKPVQARIPILLGSVTPKGIERAGRIADGLNPLAFSPESLREAAASFRRAAREAGREESGLTVVARANVPITREPITGDARPFLAGSPSQIAEDVKRLEGAGVDHVLFANMASTTIEEELTLLEELKAAVAL